MANSKKTPIVVSGTRPTGALHLGHLNGALKNWVQLQRETQCYFFVADWHALTTDYENPSAIRENTHEMILDWMAVGLDPERAVIVAEVQGACRPHAGQDASIGNRGRAQCSAFGIIHT